MAEEILVPERPRTNFFGGANPAFQAMAAGRRLEDEQLVGDALSGLSQSRLQRRLRQRQELLFDRDEQEYQAKQGFKAAKGEWYINLGRINPEADDFRDQLNNLMLGSSEEALKDEGTQVIMRQLIAANDDYQARKKAVETEERLRERFLLDDVEKATNEFLQLGGDKKELEALRQKDGSLDRYSLYGMVGQRKKKLAEEEFQRKLALEAGKPPTDTALEKEIGILLKDKNANPSHVPEAYEAWVKTRKKGEGKDMERFKKTAEYAEAEALDKLGAEDFLAILSRPDVTEEDFVNARDTGTRVLSDAAKERRREVYRLAQQRMGGAAPAAAPAPVVPPPVAPAVIPSSSKGKVPLDQTPVKLNTFKG